MENKVQLDIDFSRKARDKGIQKALDSAEERTPSWKERAYVVLQEYLDVIGERQFMTEEFRKFAEEQCGLPSPPSARAYGGPITKASRAGIIKHVGFSAVSNVRAHATPASVWIKST